MSECACVCLCVCLGMFVFVCVCLCVCESVCLSLCVRGLLLAPSGIQLGCLSKVHRGECDPNGSQRFL